MSLVFRSCSYFLLGLVTISCAVANSSSDTVRYRGDYVFGHEVNSFCPQLNSQCYWVSVNTAPSVRQQLKALSDEHRSKPYDPVCLLVEGVIDRDASREGFASDYDGLITIDIVYGVCNSTNIVTQGDLQHHRWTLAAINGVPVVVSQWKAMPTLDFGERMHVSGNDGCRDFNGWASLSDEQLSLNEVEFSDSICSSTDAAVLAIALTDTRWTITLPNPRMLRLHANGQTLEFELNDWL